jgi:hypothetical protein
MRNFAFVWLVPVRREPPANEEQSFLRRLPPRRTGRRMAAKQFVYKKGAATNVA